MSSSESPDLAAVRELEETVKLLCDELASWRRRALKAEGDKGSLGAEHDPVGQKERIVGLEGENAELRQRVEAARGRLQDLAKRLRFLEEQNAAQGSVR